ncbi:A-kinase anchor protein 9 [Trichoplax sp. H2]|nr:A-kinase anchor protein 9 [Trichoplax sp. H2]|eukprot:RDD40456.1 A-kinase anchor protein 9 [Trichoplax sp. H2]
MEEDLAQHYHAALQEVEVLKQDYRNRIVSLDGRNELLPDDVLQMQQEIQNMLNERESLEQELLKRLMDQLGGSFQEQVEQLQAQHQQELISLEEQLKAGNAVETDENGMTYKDKYEELLGQQSNLEDQITQQLIEKFQEQLAVLQQQHDEEIAELNNQLQNNTAKNASDSHTIELQNKISDLVKQLDDKDEVHQQQVENIKLEMTQQILQEVNSQFQNSIDQLQQQHEQEMTELKIQLQNSSNSDSIQTQAIEIQQLQDEMNELKKAHKLELETIHQETMDKVMDELSVGFRESLEQQKTEHEQEMANTCATLEAQVRQENNERVEELQNKLTEMDEQHRAALENLEQAVAQRTMEEVQQQLEQLQTAHEQELSELRIQLESQTKQQQSDQRVTELENALIELQEKHQNELNEVEAQVVARLMNEMEVGFQQQLQNMQAEHEQTIAELNSRLESTTADNNENEALKATLADMQEQHQLKIQSLEQELSEKLMKDMSTEFQNQLEQLQSQYETELANLRNQRDGEQQSATANNEQEIREKIIEEMSIGLQQQMEQIHTKHEEEMVNLQNQMIEEQQNQEQEIKDKLMNELTTGFQQHLQEIEAKHEEELNNVKLQHENNSAANDDVANAKVTILENQIQEMTEQHQSVMKNSEQEITQRLIDEMSAGFQQKFDQIQEEYEQKILMLENQLQNFQESNQQLPSSKQQELEEQIKVLEEQHQYTVDNMEQELTERLKTEMSAGFLEQLETLQQDYELKITTLQDQVKNIDELTLTNDTLTTKINELEVQTNDMESQHQAILQNQEDEIQQRLMNELSIGFQQRFEDLQNVHQQELLQLTEQMTNNESANARVTELETALLEMKEQYDNALQHQAAMDNSQVIIEELHAKINENNELHEHAMQNLEIKIVQQLMDEMSSGFQQRLDTIQTKYNEELLSIKSDMLENTTTTEEVEKYKNEIEEMKVKFHEESMMKEQEIIQRVMAEMTVGFQQVQQEHQDLMKNQLDENIKVSQDKIQQLEQFIDDLKAEHELTIANNEEEVTLRLGNEMKKEYQLQIEQLQQQHNDELEKLQIQLDTQNTMQNADDELIQLQAKIAEMEEMHKVQLATFENEITQRLLNEMSVGFQQQLDTIQSQHQEELSNLQTQLQDTNSKLIDHHENTDNDHAEVTVLRNQIKDNGLLINQLRSDHEVELNNLESEILQRIFIEMDAGFKHHIVQTRNEHAQELQILQDQLLNQRSNDDNANDAKIQQLQHELDTLHENHEQIQQQHREEIDKIKLEQVDENEVVTSLKSKMKEMEDLHQLQFVQLEHEMLNKVMKEMSLGFQQQLEQLQIQHDKELMDVKQELNTLLATDASANSSALYSVNKEGEHIKLEITQQMMEEILPKYMERLQAIQQQHQQNIDSIQIEPLNDDEDNNKVALLRQQIQELLQNYSAEVLKFDELLIQEITSDLTGDFQRQLLKIEKEYHHEKDSLAKNALNNGDDNSSIVIELKQQLDLMEKEHLRKEEEWSATFDEKQLENDNLQNQITDLQQKLLVQQSDNKDKYEIKPNQLVELQGRNDELKQKIDENERESILHQENSMTEIKLLQEQLKQENVSYLAALKDADEANLKLSRLENSLKLDEVKNITDPEEFKKIIAQLEERHVIEKESLEKELTDRLMNEISSEFQEQLANLQVNHEAEITVLTQKLEDAGVNITNEEELNKEIQLQRHITELENKIYDMRSNPSQMENIEHVVINRLMLEMSAGFQKRFLALQSKHAKEVDEIKLNFSDNSENKLTEQSQAQDSTKNSLHLEQNDNEEIARLLENISKLQNERDTAQEETEQLKLQLSKSKIATTDIPQNFEEQIDRLIVEHEKEMAAMENDWKKRLVEVTESKNMLIKSRQDLEDFTQMQLQNKDRQYELDIRQIEELNRLKIEEIKQDCNTLIKQNEDWEVKYNNLQTDMDIKCKALANEIANLKTLSIKDEDATITKLKIELQQVRIECDEKIKKLELELQEEKDGGKARLMERVTEITDDFNKQIENLNSSWQVRLEQQELKYTEMNDKYKEAMEKLFRNSDDLKEPEKNEYTEILRTRDEELVKRLDDKDNEHQVAIRLLERKWRKRLSIITGEELPSDDAESEDDYSASNNETIEQLRFQLQKLEEEHAIDRSNMEQEITQKLKLELREEFEQKLDEAVEHYRQQIATLQQAVGDSDGVLSLEGNSTKLQELQHKCDQLVGIVEELEALRDEDEQNHREELSHLKQQHQEQIASLISNQNNAITLYPDDSKDVIKKYEQKIADIKKEHQDTIESLTEELGAKMEQRLLALEHEHETELENKAQTVVEEVTKIFEAEFAEKLEALRIELTEDNAKEIEQLKLQHAEELQQVNDLYEGEVDSLKKEHELAKQKSDTSDERLQTLKANIEQHYEEEMESAKAAMLKEIEEMVESMESAAQKQLENLQEEYNVREQELLSSFENEKTALVRQIQEGTESNVELKILTIKEDYEKRILQERAEFDEQLQKLKESHEYELELLSKEHPDDSNNERITAMRESIQREFDVKTLSLTEESQDMAKKLTKLQHDYKEKSKELKRSKAELETLKSSYKEQLEGPSQKDEVEISRYKQLIEQLEQQVKDLSQQNDELTAVSDLLDKSDSELIKDNGQLKQQLYQLNEKYQSALSDIEKEKDKQKKLIGTLRNEQENLSKIRDGTQRTSQILRNILKKVLLSDIAIEDYLTTCTTKLSQYEDISRIVKIRLPSEIGSPNSTEAVELNMRLDSTFSSEDIDSNCAELSEMILSRLQISIRRFVGVLKTTFSQFADVYDTPRVHNQDSPSNRVDLHRQLLQELDSKDDLTIRLRQAEKSMKLLTQERDRLLQENYDIKMARDISDVTVSKGASQNEKLMLELLMRERSVELKEKIAENHIMEQKLADVDTDCRKLKEQVKQLELDSKNLESSYQDSLATNRKLQADLYQKNAEISIIEENLQHKSNRCQKLDTAVSENINEVRRLESILRDKVIELSVNDRKLQEKILTVQRLEKLNKDKIAECRNWELNAKDKTMECNILQQRLDNRVVEIEHLEKVNRERSTQLEALQLKTRNSQSENDILRTKLQNAFDDNNKLESEIQKRIISEEIEANLKEMMLEKRKLEGQVNELEVVISTMREQITKANEENAIVSKKLKDFTVENDSLRTELSGKEDEYQTLLTAYKDKISDDEKLKEKYLALANEKANLLSELSHERDSTDNLKSNLKEQKDNFNKISRKLDQVETELTEKEDQRRKLSQECHSLQLQIELLRTLVHDKPDSPLKSELTIAQRKNDTLVAQIKTLHSDCSKFKDDVISLQSHVNDLTIALNEAKNHEKTMEDTLKSLQSEVIEVKSVLQQKISTLKDLNNQKAEIEQELISLSDTHKQVLISKDDIQNQLFEELQLRLAYERDIKEGKLIRLSNRTEELTRELQVKLESERALQRERQQLSDELKQLLSVIEERKSEIVELKEEKQQAIQELNIKRDNINDLEMQVLSMHKQIDNLRQNNDEQEHLLNKMTLNLQATQQELFKELQDKVNIDIRHREQTTILMEEIEAKSQSEKVSRKDLEKMVSRLFNELQRRVELERSFVSVREQLQQNLESAADVHQRLEHRVKELTTIVGHKEQYINELCSERRNIEEDKANLLTQLNEAEKVNATNNTQLEELRAAMLNLDVENAEIEVSKQQVVSEKLHLQEIHDETVKLNEFLQSSNNDLQAQREDLISVNRRYEEETKTLRELLAKNTDETRTIVSVHENLENLLEENTRLLADLIVQFDDFQQESAIDNVEDKHGNIKQQESIDKFAKFCEINLIRFQSQIEKLRSIMQLKEDILSRQCDEIRNLQQNIMLRQNEISDRNAQLAKQDVKLISLHQEISDRDDLKVQLMEIKFDVEMKEDKISQLEEELNTQQGAAADANSAVEDLNVSINDLRRSFDDKDDQVRQYKSELEAQKATIGLLEVEANNINLKLAELYDFATSINGKEDVTIQSSSVDKSKENRIFNIDLNAISAKLEGLQSIFINRNVQFEDLRKLNEEYSVELGILRKRDLANCEKLSQLTADLEQAKSTLSEQQQVMTMLNSELGAVREDNSLKQEIINNLEHVNTDIKGKLEEMKQRTNDVSDQLRKQKSDNEIQKNEFTTRENHLAELLNLERNKAEENATLVSRLQDDTTHLENEIKEAKRVDSNLKSQIDELEVRLYHEQENCERLTVQLDSKNDAYKRKEAELQRITIQLLQSDQEHEKQRGLYEDEVKNLKNMHNNTMHMLYKNLRETFAEFFEEYDITVEDIDTNEIEERINQLITDVKGGIKERQDIKLSQLKEATVEEVTEKNKNELQLIHERQIAAMKAQFKRDLAKLRSELTQRHALQLSKLIQKHQDEIDSVRKEHKGGSNLSAENLGQILQEVDSLDQALDASPDQNSTTYHSHVMEQVQEIQEECMTLRSVVEQLPVVMTLEEKIQMMQVAFDNEKQSLLDTVKSMKDLFSACQQEFTKSERTDWQYKILNTVQDIFEKEQQALHTELLTQNLLQDGIPNIESLKIYIQQKEQYHIMAMKQLHATDRGALVSEIGRLRDILKKSDKENEKRLFEMNTRMEISNDQWSKSEAELREQLSTAKTQISLLQSTIQSLESAVKSTEDKRNELQRVLDEQKHLVTNLNDALSQERQRNAQLNMLLAKESSRSESLKESLEIEKVRCANLLEALDLERVSNNQLQSTLDLESQRRLDTSERSQETVKEITIALDAERSQRNELEKELDSERQKIASLRMHLEVDRSRNQEAYLLERNLVTELKTKLQTEKTRIKELALSLDREKDLTTQLKDTLQTERNVGRQRKHNYDTIMQLESVLDAEKTRIGTLKYELNIKDELITDLKKELQENKEQQKVKATALAQHRAEAENNQKHLIKKQQEIEKLILEKDSVAAKCDRLESTIRSINSNQSDKDMQMKNMESHLDRLRTQAKQIEELEQQYVSKMRLKDSVIDETKAKVRQLHKRLEVADDHAKLQEKRVEELQLMQSRKMNDEGTVRQLQHRFDFLHQQCQILLIKFNDVVMRRKTASRPVATDSEDFYLLEDTLLKISNELKDIGLDMNTWKEASGVDYGSSASAAMHEKLIKQNRELTSFVHQLQEDKDSSHKNTELLNKLNRELQDRIDAKSLQEKLLLREKSSWLDEKDRLYELLEKSKSELSLLKNENLQYLITRDVELSSDDVKRWYVRYLRAEGYRKALVYQKKYLLLLLGGFQECESVTLSIISKLGAYPQSSERQQQNIYSNNSNRRLRKFRIAGRSVVVILRLKFLVSKWRKVQNSNVTALLRKNQRFRKDREALTNNVAPYQTYDQGIRSWKGSKDEISSSDYHRQVSNNRDRYDVDYWLKSSPSHQSEKVGNLRANDQHKRSNLTPSPHDLMTTKSGISLHADQSRSIPGNSTISWKSNGLDRTSPQQGNKIAAMSTPGERDRSISPSRHSPNVSESSDPALTRYIHKLEALHDRLAVLDTKNNK